MTCVERDLRKYWHKGKYCAGMESAPSRAASGTDEAPGPRADRLDKVLNSSVFWCCCKMVRDLGLLAEHT
ncbi:unnamed protein product, partial [Effrenium voratum]